MAILEPLIRNCLADRFYWIPRFLARSIEEFERNQEILILNLRNGGRAKGLVYTSPFAVLEAKLICLSVILTLRLQLAFERSSFFRRQPSS